MSLEKPNTEKCFGAGKTKIWNDKKKQLQPSKALKKITTKLAITVTALGAGGLNN